MKKRLFQASWFSILWLLYCAVLIIMNPEILAGVTAVSVIAGCVFLGGTGLAILVISERKEMKIVQLFIFFLILLLLDQAAKTAVFYQLPADKTIPLIDDWLGISYTPNHHNNVIFNLLNINLSSRIADVLIKTISIVIAFGIGIYFFISYRIFFTSTVSRISIALIAAGAVCSLIDTIRFGFVLDFIYLYPLVAFDFKDLYLQYGVVLAFITFWNMPKEIKDEN